MYLLVRFLPLPHAGCPGLHYLGCPVWNVLPGDGCVEVLQALCTRHGQLILIINSLGPVDAFKRPKIFVFFSKKKKKKLA